MDEQTAAFERKFLLDYLWFGRMVLAHQSRALNDAYVAELDADRRRAFFLAIHSNLLQECEHVAAWLLAFRRWADTQTSLIETLLRYGPGEAYLEARLDGINDGPALLQILGIDAARLVPGHIPRTLFDERVADIWDGLSHYAVQQRERSQLYNKSKHGMMFVSSAAAINPTTPDLGPVALFARDRRADPLEVEFVGLRFESDQPGVTARQTVAMAQALGDIITLYILQEHPGAVADLDAMLRARGSMLMLA